MAAKIPARSTSKYCEQYVGTFDAQRVFEIFTDSNRIALSSKNPETACDRFALAVETFHQLMSMSIPGDVRASLQAAMQSLVDTFPSQAVSNEALGLREKARKLKTATKRSELLNRAREVLERGLVQSPGSSKLQSEIAEVRHEIGESETGAV
jgi:hypothetical protein